MEPEQQFRAGAESIAQQQLDGSHVRHDEHRLTRIPLQQIVLRGDHAVGDLREALTTGGGDIGVGGNNMVSALTGPALRWNPWSTPIPKAYLCSSATPPGGGVHGMAGLYAARTVLRREFGIRDLPSLAPR